MAPKMMSKEEFLGLTGNEVGVSDWFDVTQDRIDRFAEATEDDQFIHVNPQAAAQTPFGQTIAHGFLSLSMIAGMGIGVMPMVEGAKMGVNYGLNQVRFLTPVKSGKRVRGRYVMAEVRERARGIIQTTYDVTVEIEGEAKPALKAEWINLVYT